jgi:ferredoxin-NADP reductase
VIETRSREIDDERVRSRDLGAQQRFGEIEDVLDEVLRFFEHSRELDGELDVFDCEEDSTHSSVIAAAARCIRDEPPKPHHSACRRASGVFVVASPAAYIVVRSLRRMPHPPVPFDTRLVASRNLTPGVRELVLERADGAPFHFDPGQWVNLVLPAEDGEIRRAYSIASAPDGSARFEIAVTRVTGGPGSQYLHALEVGGAVHAIGPHGLFTRSPTDAAPALFVATGTGVAPLRSMMAAARRTDTRAPMWILFGARYEHDILYREEFERWAAADAGVRHFVTLSQADAGWKGRRGYVQAHVPEIWRALRDAVHPATPHMYICGLQRMVHTVRDLARGELGASRKHVHIERYD